MKKRLVSIFLCTVMTACTLVGCTSKSAMENKDSRKEAAVVVKHFCNTYG
ncbi:hypothetical protein [Sellimonas intestinalis]|nr:hypothetical protein [Sellimonas intestinalis]